MNQISMKKLGAENSRLQKKANFKSCSVPDNMRMECLGKIIKAHTISKCLGLSDLAIKGRVLGLPQKPNLFEYHKNGGKLEILEMGVNEASVLQCFCAKHDREIFSPIENEDFIASPEQCFLLAYRALINEWYKSVQVDLADVLSEKMKQKSNEAFHQFICDEIPDYVQETEWKKRDLNHDKDIFDDILINKNFSKIKHYIFMGDRSSDMVCSFTLNPDISFENKEIQNYNSPDYLASVYVNGISCEGNSYVIFSWIDNDYTNKVINNFFGGLRSKDNDTIENDIFEFIIKNSENNFFSIKWYESLNRTQTKYLDAWVQPLSNRKLNNMNHKIRFMGLQKHYLL
ncbi:hypothetical protein [Neisseria sp.]